MNVLVAIEAEDSDLNKMYLLLDTTHQFRERLTKAARSADVDSELNQEVIDGAEDEAVGVMELSRENQQIGMFFRLYS